MGAFDNLFGPQIPAANPSPSMSLLGMDPTAIRQQALYQGLLGLGSGLLQAGARSADPGNQARGVAVGLQGFQGGLMSGQQRALQQLLLQKQLNAPTISKPGDIARGPDGKELWRNAPKAPDGFEYVTGPNGEQALRALPGGPADPAVVGQKAAMEAWARLPTEIISRSATPVAQPPGGQTVVPGMAMFPQFFGGQPGAIPPSFPPPQVAPQQPPGVQPATPGVGSPQLPPARGNVPGPDAGMPGPVLRNPTPTQNIPGYRAPMGGGAQNQNPAVISSDPRPAPGTQPGKIDEWYAERFIDLQKEEITARRQNAQLDLSQSLFEKAYTGSGAEQVLALQKIGAALGIKTEGMGAAEAGQAIANQMALQLRDPSGGAGMPGALSDPDRLFLQGMTGGLTTTKEGRALLYDAYREINKRKSDVASFARQYAREHGGALDLKFDDALNERFGSKPIFGDEWQKRLDAATKAQGGGGGGSITPIELPPMKDGKPDAKQLKAGQIYKTPRGEAKWDGMQFELVTPNGR